MPRDYTYYGYDHNGLRTEFGNVVNTRNKDRTRLYTMLDLMEDWMGFHLHEKRMEQDEFGDCKVTIVFDGDAWLDREERADRLERMLKWLVLKLSREELIYLKLVSRAEDPASVPVETLIEKLTNDFDRFARADDRLRGSSKRS